MEDKIIVRIRKMLAIANDAGATEGERDNALRMAHTLLAKHNLSMSSVEVKQEKRDHLITTFYGRPWARTVCNSVAKLFFCKYLVGGKPLFGGRNDKNHYFIGKESNVATASAMAEFLVTSILKEGRRQARATGNDNRTWIRSFCIGAAAKLSQRVKEMISQDIDSTPGTALVLASLYQVEATENDQYATQWKVKEEKDRSKKTGFADAYQSGVEYGQKVHLNKQIN